MTDEQRKAAVEKAAKAIYDATFTRPEWKKAKLSLQNYYRKDAQAALKAVRYFKLVEATKNVFDNAAICDGPAGYRDVYHRDLEDLKTALKGVIPNA